MSKLKILNSANAINFEALFSYSDTNNSPGRMSWCQSTKRKRQSKMRVGPTWRFLSESWPIHPKCTPVTSGREAKTQHVVTNVTNVTNVTERKVIFIQHGLGHGCFSSTPSKGKLHLGTALRNIYRKGLTRALGLVWLRYEAVLPKIDFGRNLRKNKQKNSDIFKS